MARKSDKKRTSKDQLALAVRKHFNGMAVNEIDVVVEEDFHGLGLRLGLEAELLEELAVVGIEVGDLFALGGGADEGSGV